MFSKNVIYYGKQEDLPECIDLHAGPLSLIYQSGEIRKICFGEKEVVQRIYANVRDRNWGTVQNKIQSEEIKMEDNSFFIILKCSSMQYAKIRKPF